jgi:D-3-phosphoglycerate dehydrogenase
MSTPKIAVAPMAGDEIEKAVVAAGGEVSAPEEADGVVWTNPADPQALKELLAASPARWVQLPFAGIESFVSAGVIDPRLTWTCMKGTYGPPCAELALALMLAGARNLKEHFAAQTWRPGGFGTPERRLEGATVVILGTGGIGSALSEMLVPLKVSVVGVNRSGRPLKNAVDTVTADRLIEVVGDADFLVVTAALTPATHKIVNARVFDAMPAHSWLVNVARGGLVDTDALVDALSDGSIAGAGLDVTDPEPLPDEHPLWKLPNALITPHIANTWDMAIPQLVAQVGRNVALFAAGEPLEGVVDAEAGY